MVTIQSPLGGINIGTTTTVSIHEIAGVPMFDLRVSPLAPAFDTVSQTLGISLPVKTGTTSSAGSGGQVLCLAPDWWLLTGLEAVDKKLQSFRDDHHFSVVDVSGQRTTIELQGPNSQAVLAHLWEQDLRERVFPAGAVSQGLIAKAPVILWRITQDKYRLLVRSSFAVHVWQAIADAAVEWV